MRRSIVLSSVAAALVLAAAPARADADTARHHFEAGKKLREEGECARALPEFTQSIAAEKSIGAYYNLGYCHEQLGHRQEAYDAYKSAQQLASVKRDDRLREISGALAALLEMPHIRLALPQPLPAGLKIRVDDELIPESLYRTETVIFTKGSKSHVVVVTAPGHEERRDRIETKELRVIELRPAKAEEPPPPPPPPASGSLRTQQWLGIGLTGAGVVAGGVAALLFFDHRTEVDAIHKDFQQEVASCPPGPSPSAKACYDEDLRERNDKTTKENTRAMVLVGGTGAVALALLVSGGILFFSSPSSEATKRVEGAGVRVVPVLSGRAPGLSLVGRF